VTFNDIRTVSPSNVIDPNISDEKDLLQTLVYVDNWNKVTFDASIYGLYYNDKIGSMKLVTQMDLLLRYRSNIGTAVTYGFETMFDWNLNRTFLKQKKTLSDCLN
jgi:Fe(3+) dicitrate transport protein